MFFFFLYVLCKTEYWWVMKSFCCMNNLYHEGIYGDSEMGVSHLVASEDAAIKIRLFSQCTSIPVQMIPFPHIPFWPSQGSPYVYT